jgi:hypothetical protein
MNSPEPNQPRGGTSCRPQAGRLPNLRDLCVTYA